MPHHEDQAFCRGVCFGTSGPPPTTVNGLRRRGGSVCRERLPIWLSEFFVQVRRGEPCDRLPQQVAFGLAATLVLPHSDSPSPRESHPLATKELPPLHESYAKNPSCPEGDEFVMMLRRFARKYITRDIVEEYRSIPVCPLVDGWAVADDAWADDIGGIPCPNWTKAFGFTSDCQCSCVFRWPFTYFLCF
jgi:hypothetical protein